MYYTHNSLLGIKGTSPGEQCAFSAVPWVPLEGFPWNFISRTVRTCATKKVFCLR
jgi:hypothetical protein